MMNSKLTGVQLTLRLNGPIAVQLNLGNHSITLACKVMIKCGKCSRYLKFIAVRPSRLYCPSCEEVLAVPQVGLAGSHLSLLWIFSRLCGTQPYVGRADPQSCMPTAHCEFTLPISSRCPHAGRSSEQTTNRLISARMCYIAGSHCQHVNEVM